MASRYIPSGQQHRREAFREPLGDSPAPVKYLDSLKPYDPVSSLAKIWSKPTQVPFKLDWNEATVPPSPKVYEDIVAFLSHSNHLNWYPELGSTGVAEELSNYVSLPTDNILVTNGSDDALELICKAFLGPADKVLVPMPTYTHFLVYVQARGAEVVSHYPADIFDNDVAGIRRALTRDTRMVYLVSPNNPTGVTYGEEEVEELLESFPETIFIVDEAYFEFHGESAVALAGRYDNIVLTRTFSKCFGIAGLRMGYLCTSVGVMTQLKKLFNPKSVNRLGQIAAMACLNDLDYYRNYSDEVAASRELLKEALGRRGIEVKLTPANFVLMQVPDAARFCALLEDEGVYIRDRSSMARLESCVRITVPNLEQTRELIVRIERVLDNM